MTYELPLQEKLRTIAAMLNSPGYGAADCIDVLSAELTSARAEVVRLATENQRLRAALEGLDSYMVTEQPGNGGDAEHGWECSVCHEFWNTKHHETDAHSEGCPMRLVSAALKESSL